MKNWYKLSKENKEKADYQQFLKELHPSLRKNIYFMYGVDPVKYPQVKRKLDKLEGEEWQKANNYVHHGMNWRRRKTLPYYEKTHEMNKNKAIEDRERHLKQPIPANKGDKGTSPPLDSYFKNPSKSGWWDESQYDFSQSI